MKYAPEIKTARLEAVAKAMNASDAFPVIEIGTAGMQTVLVRCRLDADVYVEGDRLVLVASPIEAQAIQEGEPKTARMLNGAGVVIIDDMKVGPDAEVQVDAERYLPNQTIRINKAIVIHP